MYIYLIKFVHLMFKFSAFLLIFWSALSISERDELKTLPGVVDLSISPCSSVNFCFIYFKEVEYIPD